MTTKNSAKISEILDKYSHVTMIKNTVINCNSLDEGILSNITEYQIENNIILNDKQIHEICNSRTLEKGDDLEKVNKLFQQLHHNNQMIV